MSSIAFIYFVVESFAFYSSIFILSIGLISNLSLIVIFVTLRTFRGNQCAFFLTVESISNVGLLLTNLPSHIFSHITGQDPSIISVIWCKLQNALSQIFGLCALFTICFLTIDQYLSTNPRPSWRQLSSLKLARRFTVFKICVFTIHSIPFFIFTDISPFAGCTIYNVILHAYFIYFYYPILSFALPFIITITFSLLSYRNVRRIIRRQIPVIRRRLDRQLTAMVLARVLSIVLLGIPYIIFSLYRLNLSITTDNQQEVAIASLMSAITYALLYLNFAINFYLFLIVSARFRRQVKHFLVKRCWHALNSLCHKEENRHTHRNQVAPETVPGIISELESV